MDSKTLASCSTRDPACSAFQKKKRLAGHAHPADSRAPGRRADRGVLLPRPTRNRLAGGSAGRAGCASVLSASASMRRRCAKMICARRAGWASSWTRPPNRAASIAGVRCISTPGADVKIWSSRPAGMDDRSTPPQPSSPKVEHRPQQPGSVTFPHSGPTRYGGTALALCY